ncbi:acylphosphatase [Methanospirillum hungatei]|uniref:acylphosphatase n=1 Tax=Methanospirillum hungatei TaxID=2203 RepID=UPI0026EC2067|nr:acylphosphatase [Methanospirillum hungatei]MCA1914907.1 acylphosphatase [Methanospirillum hungatei]
MSDSNKKQYHIFVKGKVQRVGFRDKVEDIADGLELTGYVQNHSSKDVIIVIEGEEEKITEFIQSIRNIPPPVKIKSLQVTEYPYSGNYSEFTILRGEMMEELAERFDSAIYYLHNLDQKQDQMLNKQDQMLDKQDQMLNKQDQMLGKQDTVIGLQIETLREIKGVRSDFQKTFTEELIEIRGEIRELRSAMIEAGYLKKADVR